MTDPESSIDEAARRRFEQDRRAGGSVPIESFLPPPGDPTRTATLEELVCIELEFAIKRDASTAPSIADFVERFAELRDPIVQARLAAEVETLHDLGAPAGGDQPGDPVAGEQLGRYELDAPVGRGAFAEVWRARDTQLHRVVAIKITRPDLAAHPDARARVHREARSAAQLRHPGIVPVYDVVDRHGCPCIVSEYLVGDTLARRLARARPDPDTAARWIADLAEAVDYAHQCGVIHRDVKPGNVLMSDTGRPKLTDFGLAQLADTDMTLTRQGDVLGTPAYLSPEQARGHHEDIDARTDIYSLGVMLYEALLGKRPHEGHSTARMLYAVIHEDPPRPRSIAADIPADLETICLTAMAKERDRRFGSAAELAADLRRFLAREPIQARRLSPFGRTLLWARRNKTLAATITISLVLVTVVAVVGYVGVLRELYRSRLGQIDALIVAQDSDWHGDATRVLTAAAAMRVRDERELRDRALTLHSARQRWFTPTAEWSVPGLRRVAATADGTRIAACTGQGRVSVHDAATGEILAHRDFGRLPLLCFTPDGRTLVVATDGQLHWWIVDAEKVRDAPLPAGRLHALTASATHAFTAGKSGTIHCVDRETGEVTSLEGHPGGTHALALDAAGTHLASGGEDNRLRVIATATGQLVATGQSPNPVQTVAFVPGRKEVLWSAWETYGFGTFPFETHPETELMPYVGNVHDSAVRTIVPGARGVRITASADGTIRAWSKQSDQIAIARAHKGSVFHAASAAGADLVAGCYADDRVRVWRLQGSPYHRSLQPSNCIGFAPDPGRLFVSTGEYRFQENDLSTLTFRGYPRTSHHGPTWGLDASTDGRWLATTSHDGFVEFWDLSEMRLVHGIAPGWDPGWGIAFRPGTTECTVGFEQGMVTYDAATGAELRRIEGHDRLVVALAYHPTYPVLVSASYDSTIQLWDARDGRSLGTLADSPTPWHKLLITADGRFLVIACGDSRVRIHDLSAAGLARTFAAEPARLEAAVAPYLELDEPSAVWSLAQSPDGQALLTGTQNGEVSIYEGSGFRRVARFTPGLRMIRSMSFSRDGRFLSAGCYGQTSALLDFAGLRKELRALGLDW